MPEELGRRGSSSFLGRNVSKTEIVFLAQIIMIYIVILSSLINVSFNIGNQSLFICLISSCLGYLLPSPKAPGKGKNDLQDINSLKHFAWDETDLSRRKFQKDFGKEHDQFIKENNDEEVKPSEDIATPSSSDSSPLLHPSENINLEGIDL